MKRLFTPIYILLLVFLSWTAAWSQCNNNEFTMSATTVCGNEEIMFTIDNPNPNLTYFWNFGNGGGVNTEGDTVYHTYPARDFDRTFNVTVFNNSGSCVQTVEVLSTPDAALTALTGANVEGNVIAFCQSTSDFPEFELTVANDSETGPINSNYTIDWGDGTPPWTGASFTEATHIYLSQGQFTLTLTVDGSTNCPSSSVEYTVFNSSDPGGSIVNTTNTITTCFPNTIGYPILGTENNIPGTTYEITISGETVATYAHPPPDTFYHTFEETSCGQGSFPFDNDEFVIQMEVESPCQNKLSFVTARLGTPPLASFSMNPTVICPDETVLFTNTSEGSLSSQELCEPLEGANWMIEPRSYIIISGDTIDSEELEVEFLDNVDYTITMWVENMCGADTIEQIAEVGINPEADAVATLLPTSSCAPAVATFVNNSTVDSSVTYNWSVVPGGGVNFLSGTNASTFEPEIEFTAAGDYVVTLTVSNECGSPTWDTTFSIIRNPQISLPEIENVCADTFIYNSNAVISGGPDNVVWTFTGGNPATFNGINPPPVIFTGNGTYSVSVFAENVCGDSTATVSYDLSDPIPIDAGPDFGVCFNETPVTLTGSPAGGTWTGNGVTSNTFDPSAISDDQVTLTYTVDNGICTISDDVIVTIVRINGLTAGDNEATCLNTGTFNLSGASPAGGSWSGTGITNASLGTFDPSISGLGTFTIGYVFTEPSLGCMDIVYKEVEVLDIPNIAISAPDTACLDASVSFTTTTLGGGVARWDFGDGNTANGFSVNHTYSNEGSYWVVVEVEAAAGCLNQDSTLVQVITLPTAQFDALPPIGCNGLTVDFDNQSSGVIQQSFWDFGTGDTSLLFEPLAIDFPTGTYNDTAYYVTLTVSNQCGADSYTDSVFVTKKPEALFGTNVNAVCPEQDLLINNISYNSPDDFFWDFGNGETSTDEQPGPVNYPVPDADTIYVITLIATNECGADTLTKDILVKTTNVVSFFNTDPISGCEPLEVNFISYSTLNSSLIWDFDDGNTATEDTLSHIFQDDGTYTVSLAVDNGCSKDTSTVDIEVLPSPDVRFIHAELGCEEADLELTNLSEGAFGYEWDFGDGNTSIEVSPLHEYAISGNYNITLVGENQYGCSSSFESAVSILSKPYADFDASINSFCVGTDVEFFNESENAENYEWQFGDGSLSFLENPVKQYEEAGIYDVTLIANNDNFCFDTIVYPGVVEVFPVPEADFDYTQTEEGIRYGDVTFNNLTTDAESFVWDFGDGLASIETDPVHRYSQSGQYAVLLTAENQYACVDSILKFINVEFFGKLYVPNAFSPVLGSNSDASIFLPKGVALQEYEMEIYSSYGELLHRSTELIDGRPASGWDGNYNGKAMPQDVYVWKIRAIFDNGTSWEGTDVGKGVISTVGTLTLIR